MNEVSYRIRRFNQKFKRYTYFSGHICDTVNKWVVDIRDSFIYFDKKDAEKDIKKYKLKNCEVYYEK